LDLDVYSIEDPSVGGENLRIERVADAANRDLEGKGIWIADRGFDRPELNYPNNEQFCQEAVWLTQNMLLGSKGDTGDIANAIQKIYENRDKLA
jgi:hypothetical protein